MSTRKHKTRQRKLARLEDREHLALVLERLAKLDEERWEPVNLDDLRVKYGYDKGKDE